MTKAATRPLSGWPAWAATVRAAALAAGVCLSGCGNMQQTLPDASDAPASGPMTLSAFEAVQRQSALEFERQARLADAAWAWEVLTVLRPGEQRYRDSLASARRQIDAAVADHVQRAAQAQKRGEPETAATQYLMALSLQPDHVQAADALRSIERDRNRRTYLGKPSRVTLARRGPETEKLPAAARATVSRERNDFEHATLLAAQGEVDDAIALVERRMPASRRDASARRLLADLYCQKAEALAARRDTAAAIAALRKTLALEAGHARAGMLMKQLQAAGQGAAASSGDVAATLPARGVR